MEWENTLKKAIWQSDGILLGRVKDGKGGGWGIQGKKQFYGDWLVRICNYTDKQTTFQFMNLGCERVEIKKFRVKKA